MKERAPKLEVLQERQAQLSEIISQRRELYGAIGTGRIQEGSSWEQDIKIGRTKTRVTASIIRLESRLNQVGEEINEIRDTEQLLTRVQEYTEQVASRKKQLKEIRRYAQLGNLSKDTLERREAELRILAGQPGTDSGLKKGLELLRQRKEEEKRKPKEKLGILPEIFLDRENKTVKVNQGSVIRLGKLEFALLEYLYDRPNEEIPIQLLKEVLAGAGSKAKLQIQPALFLWGIEKKNLKQKIFRRIRDTNGSRWALDRQVEKPGEEPKPQEPAELGRKRYQEARQFSDITLPDGQSVRIQGNLKAQALEALLQSSIDNSVTSKDLSSKLYGEYSRKFRALASVIVLRLRKDLKPFGWQIIQPISSSERAKGKIATYYLERTPREDLGATKIESREFPPPLMDSRKKALVELIENSDISPEQIIDILGPSKVGKRLTPHQAWWALRNAVNFLYLRKAKMIATQEELTFWERIKTQVDKEEDRDFAQTFIQQIKDSIEGKKEIVFPGVPEVAEAQLPEIEPLSPQETAVLSSLIHIRRDLISGYGVDPLPLECVRDAVRSILPLELTSTQLNEWRRQALAKVEDVIKSDRLDQIYNTADSNTQSILIYFLGLEKSLEIVKELLTYPIETFWKEEQGLITEFRRQIITDFSQ